jgi:uncharacterized protein YigA (DUF484 family)
VLPDLWAWFVTAVWPNIVASFLWAVPAFVIAHRQLVHRLHRHHERMAQDLAEQIIAGTTRRDTP